MVSAQTVIVATPEQVFADLDGEAVILDLQNGMYYGLDAIGAHIWTLIQEPRTVEDIRDTMFAEYEVEPDQLDADLTRFLGSLMEKGLAQVMDS